jgi:MFS family permease
VPAPTPAAPAAAPDAGAARTLLLASTAGTVVEWYDFFVFASAAALVFDRLFFPRADPLTGVLLALMTYAVGFVTRPLGGVLFGVLGDRHGRKRALVWSLLLMGAATVGVGLLPTYATAGALAPTLLVVLRLVQGLAVGGEVGGAVLLVAESLPAAERGRWTAWPQTGGPAGNVAAAAVLAACTALLSDRAFLAWGWRVPFLLSALLVGVGLWTRRRVEESPLYADYQARRAGAPPAPLGRTLAAQWRRVVRVLLVKAGENALFYVFTTFLVVYATRVLHRPRGVALAATLVASAAEVPVIVLAGGCRTGWGGGRDGRRARRRGRCGRSPFPARGARRVGRPRGRPRRRARLRNGVIRGRQGARCFRRAVPTGVRTGGFSLGLPARVGGVRARWGRRAIGVALPQAVRLHGAVSAYAAAMAVPAWFACGAPRETRGAGPRRDRRRLPRHGPTPPPPLARARGGHRAVPRPDARHLGAALARPRLPAAALPRKLRAVRARRGGGAGRRDARGRHARGGRRRPLLQPRGRCR